MCGIAGFYGHGGLDSLHAMTDALIHRGPDEEGFYRDGALHLGHRRLSIVDLEYGQQPMRDAESETVIVYNGEVYNHLEIRQRLEQLGHRFQTSHSDTETILRAFLEWGTDSFAMLNGMFALAIYSAKRKKIWLARDRFGEKPLFYTRNSNGFAFASEIASLAKWPHFNTSIASDNLQRFLGWGYLPQGRTLHPNCYGLLPASWLSFDLMSGAIHEELYWEFELAEDKSLTDKDEPRLIEELRHLLIQSVKRRLLSDVPLGIFLSGGLDSSSVLAAATHSVDPSLISAFSIGFHEKSFDESVNAREVAQSFGVQHFLQMLSAEDMLQTAPSILQKMSEPLGDASLIPTEHLAEFARKRVTVALSGDGGDELFAGYDPFKAIFPASLYRAVVPSWVHRPLRKALQNIRASDKNMSLEFKLKRVLRGLSYPQSMQLPVWMSPLEPHELTAYFDRPLSAEEMYEDALLLREKHPRADEFSQALYFFTRFYLTDDILVKVDRACMMVSLESRAVFLDNDIVDFCQRLPNHFKYHRGQRKYLLRKALEGWIPKRILELPKKGFGIPLNKWLRSMPNPHVMSGMKTDHLDAVIQEHTSRHGDHRLFLWALHSLNALKYLV